MKINKTPMITIAAVLGGAGAISYVLHGTSQPETPTPPIKTQRKGKKS